jgi:hypothetical protein
MDLLTLGRGVTAGLVATGVMTLVELPARSRWGLQGLLDWQVNQRTAARILHRPVDSVAVPGLGLPAGYFQLSQPPTHEADRIIRFRDSQIDLEGTEHGGGTAYTTSALSPEDFYDRSTGGRKGLAGIRPHDDWT